MRRISLVTTVVAICALAFAVAGPAVAGAKSKTTKHSSKSSKLKLNASCSKLLLSDEVPAADTGITPPLASGSQFGTVGCGGKLGSGLATDSFALQQSGDLTGSLSLYFGKGEIKGKYDLTQAADQPLPTPYTFGNADYVGTIKVTGGSGTYAKVAGKGTLVCTTLDSVHYSCGMKLKLTLPAAKKS